MTDLLLGILLKEIELFALWSLILTTIGVQRVYRFSMRKAGVITVLYWILSAGVPIGLAILPNISR